MRHILTFITVFFVFSQFVLAQSLFGAIEKIISKSKVSSENLSIVIAESGAQKPTYQLNETKKMIPASLTKIATAAAILEKFSANHQFVTQLSSTAKISDGVLKGDLYFRGDGDPGFVSESMWFLVNELTRSGVKSVEGQLIIDDSKFDDVRFDSSREDVRVDRAYDSPIGGLTLNWSAVNIFIRPAAKVGDPALVFADPDCDYIKVKSKVETTKGSRSDLEVIRIDGVLKSGEQINASGKIGIEAKEAVFYKAIKDPVMWVGYQARCFLKQRGIGVTGDIKRGIAPANAQVLAAVKSKPTSHIVADMMKFSNNYIAEIMTKNLAAQYKTKPARMEDGVQVIRDYLNQIGISDFTLVNPSGLSRENKFQAIQLYQILKRVDQNFGILPEYLFSLPIAGVDGTLKNRLTGLDESRHIRAKTGQLSGVIGLSGFIGRDDGRRYLFVMLYNGSNSEMFKAKDLFDQIAVTLAHAK